MVDGQYRLTNGSQRAYRPAGRQCAGRRIPQRGAGQERLTAPAMNVSETYIRRPIATSLMMLGLLVFGVATYGLLPVSALPNVDFPTISVSATLPGASPETMASSVATPLEQQFAAIPGLASMSSTSGLSSTQITLQFDLNRKIDGAATDVQTAINAASGLLPKDLPNPPTYRKVNPADRAVLIYAVWSDELPLYKVDDYAFVILAQKLSAVDGVSQVLVAGQQDYAVRVQVNPAALAVARHRLRGRAGGDRQRHGQSGQGQPGEQRSLGDDRHQRPALQGGRLQERHRRLQERRAGQAPGYRRRHRWHAGAAHWRLVQRQARRIAADLPPARRQYGGDRRKDQGA